MNNIELEKIINQKLNINSIQEKDSLPNGLQVEGRKEIKRIVTGVTACQILLNRALEVSADAIIVHHGYFWKKERPVIRGIKRHRLKTLLEKDLNLYAWHLPLDIHPILGNNAQLAASLGLSVAGSLGTFILWEKLVVPTTGESFRQLLEHTFKRSVLHYSENAPEKIRKVAWCTGKGQDFIELASDAGMDAFISGEVSENTIHIVRERGVHFYAAGHHATERGGIRALGEWLTHEYGLDVMFIDVPNPV